jgi:hypothetical protein
MWKAKMTGKQLRVAEFGAYEENGVFVAGWRLVNGPFASVILQDDPSRSLDEPGLAGPYVEIDGRGNYGTVTGFTLDDRGSSACLSLQRPGHSAESWNLAVPPSATPQEHGVLRTLAASLDAFLR